MSSQRPDTWVTLMPDGPEYLRPFCNTKGSARSLVAHDATRSELINAGVLLRVRSRWMINPAKFVAHYEQKTKQLA